MEAPQDLDSFDLRAPFRRLRRVLATRWRLVAAVCLTSVALVALFIAWRPPVYVAGVVLMGESENDLGRERFYDQWNVFRKDDVHSEPQLIAGGPVLWATIDKLDLRWDDVYHPIGSQLTEWWRTSWIGNAYRSVKYAILTKPTSPWDLTPEQEERVRTLLDLRQSVGFEGVAETLVGKVTLKGPSPRVAEIVNTLAETYLEQRADRYRAEALAANELLGEQVERAYARVLDLQAEQEAFRNEHDLYLDFEKQKAAVAQWTTLEIDMVNKRMLLAEQQAELQQVERLLAIEPPLHRTMSTWERNEVVETLRATLGGYQVQLAQVKQMYRDGEPEVRIVEESIARLDRLIEESGDMVLSSYADTTNATWSALSERRAELLRSTAGLGAGLAVLEAEYERHIGALKALPSQQRQMLQIGQQIEVAWSLYRELLDKQTQAAVSMATAGETVSSMKIVERAQPPTKPAWPNTKLLLAVAVLVGLLLGTGAAWLVDLLDDRVRRHHVEQGRGESAFYTWLHEVGTKGRMN